MKGIDVIVEQAGTRYQVAVVRVLGQIDTSTSHELERRLQYLLKDHQFDVVIDLSKVTYISSAGWGIFISEIRGIRESGGDLKLAGMSAEVAEVFELLEFHNILESYRTVEGAVEKFERTRLELESHPEGSEEAGYDGVSAVEDTEALFGTNVESVSPATDELVGLEAEGASPPSDGAEISAPAESPDVSTGPMSRNPDAMVSRAGTATDYDEESARKSPAGAPGAQQPQQWPSDSGLERLILDIVKEHPEYGCLKIRKELFARGYRKQLNPLAVFIELKRLSLETGEKRKAYTESTAAVESKE